MKRALYAIPGGLLLLSACSEVCGDGVLNDGEECDDGNAVDTDDCPSTCLIAACGDSFVRSGVEECDDANNIDSDACTNACNNAECGDGIIFNQGGGVESCDDANNTNTDGCTNDCEIDPVIRNFEITTRKNVALTDVNDFNLCTSYGGYGGCYASTICDRTFTAPVTVNDDLDVAGSYTNNFDCADNNFDANVNRAINNGNATVQTVGVKYGITFNDGAEAIALDCNMTAGTFDLNCKDAQNQNWVLTAQQ
jgi:cysteine-rich repeat protein